MDGHYLANCFQVTVLELYSSLDHRLQVEMENLFQNLGMAKLH